MISGWDSGHIPVTVKTKIFFCPDIVEVLKCWSVRAGWQDEEMDSKGCWMKRGGQVMNDDYYSLSD